MTRPVWEKEPAEQASFLSEVLSVVVFVVVGLMVGLWAATGLLRAFARLLIALFGPAQ